MMTLRCILIPAIPPQVFCSPGVVVTYEFVKRSIIPGVESGINLRANIFGASDESDELQDNYMKNDLLLGVPLPRSYVIDICCKG